MVAACAGGNSGGVSGGIAEDDELCRALVIKPILMLKLFLKSQVGRPVVVHHVTDV